MFGSRGSSRPSIHSVPRDIFLSKIFSCRFFSGEKICFETVLVCRMLYTNWPKSLATAPETQIKRLDLVQIYIKQGTRFKDFSAIYKIHSFQEAKIFPALALMLRVCLFKLQIQSKTLKYSILFCKCFSAQSV